MKLANHARAILFLSLAACAAPGQTKDAAFGDKIPNLGEIRGLTSFRAREIGGRENREKRFLAVWYFNMRPKQTPSYETFLVIFEAQPDGYKESFRYTAQSHEDLSGVTALASDILAGVVVKFSGISDYDAAKVVALVNGRFQFVFNGETSEFFDLNADGYPEIFESSWPDGDGYPQTTTVHVWDGISFRRLLKTTFRGRFDSAVSRAVGRAARRLNNKAADLLLNRDSRWLITNNYTTGR